MKAKLSLNSLPLPLIIQKTNILYIYPKRSRDSLKTKDQFHISVFPFRPILGYNAMLSLPKIKKIKKTKLSIPAGHDIKP